MSRHFQLVLPLLVGSGMAQCILVALDNGSPGRQLLAAVVCFAIVLAPLALLRQLGEKTVIMLLVTVSLGGLGMKIGGIVDVAVGNPPALCHPAAAATAGTEFLQLVVNWMNGLMLAACIPGCLLLCPRSGNRPRELMGHLCCTLGMWAGMIAGGRLLGSIWSAQIGASGGMHLAMLVGMLWGVAAIECVRRLLGRLTPYHENQGFTGSC